MTKIDVTANEVPAKPGEVTRPFNELVESGLLWLINREVMHPRGYALAVGLDAQGNAIGWGIEGDGTEPWQYACDDDTQAREAARFAQIKELLP